MATIYGLGGEGIAISRRTNRASRSNRININRNIRAKEVRVIDPDGNQIGIIPTYKAIAVANDFGLDLVEISPNADPPVCKIMDYGRYKYELTKKDKVKVTVIFRGREITLTQQGRKLLEKIVQETEEIASVEQHPKFEGRTMVMVLAPKPAIIAS
ncbi:MAG: translation initiation factor IF-3 [Deltaproteobacteria bacterium]|nr:translation initiation factor IF-3 [Deltaproteobacteria bacterium]